MNYYEDYQMYQELFEKLNERQIEAVTTTEGYVRIIAGAGSGKTKALTNRYAYLVRAAGINPGSILCVTFTNKAAGEMKKRVRALVGEGYDTSLITTYHGFCVRVLRENIGRLFFPDNFQILDTNDQKTILEEIYNEFELKLDHASFEKIIDTIDKKKATTSYVDYMISRDINASLENLTLDDRIVMRYMQKQKKIFGLDFNDLINFVFVMFERFPDVKNMWQQRLEYIQVDEFQDSSSRELKLINMLSEQKRNLFVVGDPDQNIYEWRGAKVEILVDFDRTHPNTQTIIMDQNYRSTARILNVANTLIDYNKNRIKKNLFNIGNTGNEVIHLHAKNELEECQWITSEINYLKQNGYTYNSIAILYRSGFLSRSIEQNLMNSDIPYEIVGSTSFFKRMEIVDAIAYLRLVMSDDDIAFARIANTPRRQFGKVRMNLLRNIASDANLPLYETLKIHMNINEFSHSGISSLIDVIEAIRLDLEKMSVSELLNRVLNETGYEQYIRESGNMDRFENINELKKITLEHERNWGEKFTLGDFLRQIALMKDIDSEEFSDKVKLMTIHAAKGLEFPVCFVLGMTDGIFPSSRTIEERGQAGLEEERRLCFVAVTRAMKKLYLTDSEGSNITGNGEGSYKKVPSRFLFEIGENNYRRIGEISKELLNDIKNKPSYISNSPKLLSVGDRVEHSIFGSGTIVGIEKPRNIYNIKFDKNNEIKPISTDYDFKAWSDVISVLAAKKSELNSQRDLLLKNDMKTQGNEASQENLTSQKNDFLHNDITLKNKNSTEQNIISEQEISNEQKTKNEDNERKKEELFLSEINKITNEISKEEIIKNEVLPKIDEQIKLDFENNNKYIETQNENEKPIQNVIEKKPKKYKNEEDIINNSFDEDNLWKHNDIPHSGWSCVGIIDLGEPLATCKMCGKQTIRYIHQMHHDNYMGLIGAGCICAGKMEGNEEAAKKREADYKNRENRRKSFISHQRKKSKNGNEYIKYKDNLFTIIPDKYKKGYYKVVFNGVFTMPYTSVEEALSAAFDLYDV